MSTSFCVETDDLACIFRIRKFLPLIIITPRTLPISAFLRTEIPISFPSSLLLLLSLLKKLNLLLVFRDTESFSYTNDHNILYRHYDGRILLKSGQKRNKQRKFTKQDINEDEGECSLLVWHIP